MTKTRRKYLLFAVLAGLFCFSTQNADVFNEELFIKPLKSGHVNTYFQFTTQWNIDSPSDLLHTHLAPRSLAELFLHYPINELHVSLTSGLWRAEKFGYPVVDAPAGAELWAWFHNDSHVDEHWVELAGTLSGLLCASLSFVDQSNTVAPEISLRPQFYDPTVKNPVLRYSTLPREVVCTENLTPWKKLLPCSYKEGLASLLRPENLYSTSYHSLGIHVRKICDSKACLSYTLEIRQTVNLVHDFVIFGGRDWSVRKLFGQGINGVCSLADSSKVYVDVTETNYEITPTPTEVITSSRGGSESEIAVFDLQKEFRSQLMNIAVVDKSDPDTIPLLLPPPIVAKRAILGVGQERGKIVTRLINKHWQSLNVVVLENIPWFVPVYLHTLALKVANSGASIKPTFIKYIPGEQRVRPYHLEIAFSIPARSTVEISIDFDYIFLKWQEYPPDANHGHYLGAAIVSVLLPVARNYTGIPVEGTLFRDSFNASRPEGYFIQLRTESLLITLPTPDFSMPYNVICLACTVVALAFGPIHNMATKKIVLKSKTETRGRISKILGRFRRKKEEEKSDEVEPEKEKTD